MQLLTFAMLALGPSAWEYVREATALFVVKAVGGNFKRVNGVVVQVWLGKGATDSTLEALAPLKGLVNLSLDGSKVTDDGLKHLSPFKGLDLLNLSETGVTDARLKHLTPLTS